MIFQLVKWTWCTSCPIVGIFSLPKVTYTEANQSNFLMSYDNRFNEALCLNWFAFYTSKNKSTVARIPYMAITQKVKLNEIPEIAHFKTNGNSWIRKMVHVPFIEKCVYQGEQPSLVLSVENLLQTN